MRFQHLIFFQNIKTYVLLFKFECDIENIYVTRWIDLLWYQENPLTGPNYNCKIFTLLDYLLLIHAKFQGGFKYVCMFEHFDDETKHTHYIHSVVKSVIYSS